MTSQYFNRLDSKKWEVIMTYCAWVYLPLGICSTQRCAFSTKVCFYQILSVEISYFCMIYSIYWLNFHLYFLWDGFPKNFSKSYLSINAGYIQEWLYFKNQVWGNNFLGRLKQKTRRGFVKTHNCVLLRSSLSWSVE